jgi:hypothetical protein
VDAAVVAAEQAAKEKAAKEKAAKEKAAKEKAAKEKAAKEKAAKKKAAEKKAAKKKAAETVKLDDNARAACQVLVLNAADVTTKQDRSDLARAVNAYARQSDTPQIVDAGEFLTDSVGSWTGFMWTGAVGNFADVCDKGKAFR